MCSTKSVFIKLQIVLILTKSFKPFFNLDNLINNPLNTRQGVGDSVLD